MKKNENYKWIVGFIIGVLLAIPLVYAVTTYASSDVYYNNSGSSLASADVEGAIDELVSKYNGVFTCSNNIICYDKPPVKVGDYVYMTPTLTSATTDPAMTGYSESQTFNPSELNLWRVISVNDNGTVDMISEYVSSVSIYFEGTTGYSNFVGYLNELARMYENSTYTTGARNLGYNGQTEYLVGTFKIISDNLYICSSNEDCNLFVDEAEINRELLNNDLGLIRSYGMEHTSTPPDATPSNYYWVVDPYYAVSDSDYILVEYKLGITGLDYGCDLYRSSDDFSLYGSLYGGSLDASLRPIVTLKAGLKYTGSGTSNEPWMLSV